MLTMDNWTSIDPSIFEVTYDASKNRVVIRVNRAKMVYLQHLLGEMIENKEPGGYYDFLRGVHFHDGNVSHFVIQRVEYDDELNVQGRIIFDPIG